ncbi:IS1595 family transposase [Aliifodinibius sp. 1BSP15-2V2]|uniref:IS1595 family transposase n=1 Tax=Fodinibius salsisoli TaxID=2820877 RepID=A0ABT3PNV8_9BACT|nr:IS1595 family transposase [Fodinibius salsisoli]
MTNKYVHRSRISEAKFRELVRLFALDLTAIQIAELAGLNRNTINRYLTGIRERIAEYCRAKAPFTHERRDGDENRIKKKCVGITEWENRMYALLLERDRVLNTYPMAKEAILVEIDLIIDVEDNRHIWQTEDNGAKKRRIDGFWGYVTTRLEKFKGIHSQTYFLHLKESEFRFNNEKDELYHLILKIIRNHPLF